MRFNVPVHALEAVELLPDGGSVAHVDRRRLVRREVSLVGAGFPRVFGMLLLWSRYRG